jgi:hypothetical protein
MANRTFWGVQCVGIAPEDTTSFTVVHGLQSAGMTTTFNLDQIYEIGQLSIYENIEDIPDIEVTLEKVIDGWPLIYHLATQDASAATLSGRSAAKCNVALNIYDDTFSAATGTPTAQVDMSGMYVSSVTYTLPTDGSCTESVTLVGNNREWRTSGFTLTNTEIEGSDVPVAGSGGVQRRENVLFAASSIADPDATLLPSGAGGVAGISSSGTNDKTADTYGCHVSSITTSVDFGRTNVNELGRRGPYYRFVDYPTEVTTDIEIISTQGDLVEATEAGVAGNGSNLYSQKIFIALEDSTKIDLGQQNKLASVTYGGGDTGGGNVTVTYSYSTFNDFTVTHGHDPAGL